MNRFDANSVRRIRTLLRPWCTFFAQIVTESFVAELDLLGALRSDSRAPDPPLGEIDPVFRTDWATTEEREAWMPIWREIVSMPEIAHEAVSNWGQTSGAWDRAIDGCPSLGEFGIDGADLLATLRESVIFKARLTELLLERVAHNASCVLASYDCRADANSLRRLISLHQRRLREATLRLMPEALDRAANQWHSHSIATPSLPPRSFLISKFPCFPDSAELDNPAPWLPIGTTGPGPSKVLVDVACEGGPKRITIIGSDTDWRFREESRAGRTTYWGAKSKYRGFIEEPSEVFWNHLLQSRTASLDELSLAVHLRGAARYTERVAIAVRDVVAGAMHSWLLAHLVRDEHHQVVRAQLCRERLDGRQDGGSVLRPTRRSGGGKDGLDRESSGLLSNASSLEDRMRHSECREAAADLGSRSFEEHPIKALIEAGVHSVCVAERSATQDSSIVRALRLVGLGACERHSPEVALAFHVAALEALLVVPKSTIASSADGIGIDARLRRRCAALFATARLRLEGGGYSGREIELPPSIAARQRYSRIEKSVKSVYEVRCRVLHGDLTSQHAREAAAAVAGFLAGNVLLAWANSLRRQQRLGLDAGELVRFDSRLVSLLDERAELLAGSAEMGANHVELNDGPFPMGFAPFGWPGVMWG